MKHAFPKTFPADQRLTGTNVTVDGMKNNQTRNDNIRPAFGQPVQVLAFLVRHGRQHLHKMLNGLRGQGITVGIGQRILP
ncbi:hypothetical protein D3C75_1242090 [compost metagenome]